MKCNCEKPLDVFNGVCGGCLSPIPGTTHDANGKLIAYKKPKGKKRAKDEKLSKIIWELERFGRLNPSDIPAVVEALRKVAG